MIMTKNQEVRIAKQELKSTELGQYILEKYTPKKDLIRKLAEYGKGVFTYKTLERVKSCGDFMQHLTTQDLSVKRVHRSNSCGNRFCPLCTWNKAKKDAIMISVTMQAIREEKEQEYIFLTLTAPNVTGVELKNEIDRFNKAFKKLFDRRNVKKVINGYVRKLEVTYNNERFITKEMYKRAKDYFDKRELAVGGVASEKCRFTTLRICKILCKIMTNAASTKISVNVAGTGFLEPCIKSCIDIVTRKKPQTLIVQRLWLFCMRPNFDLGTLFCIGSYI